MNNQNARLMNQILALLGKNDLEQISRAGKFHPRRLRPPDCQLLLKQPAVHLQKAYNGKISSKQYGLFLRQKHST